MASKSKTFFIGLIAIVLVSSCLIPGASAQTDLINDTDSGGYASGGGSEGGENHTTLIHIDWGYVQAKCAGESFAWAYMEAASGTYTGTTGNVHVYIQVKVKNMGDDSSYTWNAIHDRTMRVRLIDTTTGQTVYQDSSLVWDNIVGPKTYNYDPTVYLVNGHSYVLQGGPYTYTDRGWLDLGWGYAYGAGTITLLRVYY